MDAVFVQASVLDQCKDGRFRSLHQQHDRGFTCTLLVWCFFFFFFTFLVAAPRPVHSLAESLAGLTMTLSLTAVGCHFHCSFCQRHVNKGSHVDAVNRMCHGLRTMITDGFFHHQLDGISLTMHLLLVYMWKVHLHPSLS